MPYINNLAAVRKEARRTQTECAKYLGVTPKGYAWYENAHRVYYDVLARLSEYFGVPVERLFPKV